MKENLEQTSEMQEEAIAPTAGAEEEVVVDAVDSAPITLSNRDLDAPRDFVVGPQQLLGLDHAVLQSIDRCRMCLIDHDYAIEAGKENLSSRFTATEDLKRKMYSCVLVVGSGMKFQGIGMWLHNRISLQIPYMYRAGKCTCWILYSSSRERYRSVAFYALQSNSTSLRSLRKWIPA